MRHWFTLFSLIAFVGTVLPAYAGGSESLSVSKLPESPSRYGRSVDLSTISKSPTAVDELVIETSGERSVREPVTPVPAPRTTWPREPAGREPRIGVGESCPKVCADIKAFIRRDARNVELEYERWMERLGLKGDIVIYPREESAALRLLRYMANDYVTRAPENQMSIEFLAELMNKCFPEAVVDEERARMSALVQILWAANKLQIEKQIYLCN